MLYKSREQTPDRANVIPETDQRGNKGYDEVQFQRPNVDVPMMGIEGYGPPKEVGPPPKEPPIGGMSSFRIMSKKKYAQIPGLSSGDPAQTITYNAHSQNIPIGENMPFIGQNMPPFGQNMPSASGQNVPSTGQIMPHIGQHMPPPSLGQNVAPTGQNMPNIGQRMPPFAPNEALTCHNMPSFCPNVPPIDHNLPPLAPNVAPIGQNMLPNTAPKDHKMQPISQNVPTFFNPNVAKINEPLKQVESVFETRIFNPVATESLDVKTLVSASESKSKTMLEVTEDSQQNFFIPTEQKDQAPQNIPQNPNVPGTASIIPPPPMFSNLQRRDSQPSIGKSILPPSVARRISANQSIMKPTPVSTPSFSENIFVPSSVSEIASKSSGQADNRFPTGLPTSTFVSSNATTIKWDPLSPAKSVQQMMTPPSIPPSMSQANAPTYFIPSNEDKSQASTEVPTFYSPQEIEPPVANTLNMVPPSADLITPVSNSTFVGRVDLSSRWGNVGPWPLPPPTPSIILTEKMSPASNSILQQREPDNSTLPSTLFNPLQHAQTLSTDAPHPITQFPPVAIPEPPKPVAEPPKASGNVNFRMTKKRPQYYAGPIEGVGAISNNIKPIIAPVIPSATLAETSNFQGALFTPEQAFQPTVEQYAAPNIELASVPFNISRPVENMILQTPFEIGKPQEQTHGSTFNLNQQENQTYGLEYNTAFDMSRATTDTYEPPKQESRGFGIIGSLKSKLSSIDINKIQSTVTTFFDPAYNENKVAEVVAQGNSLYGHQQQYEHQQYGQSSQGQANFDIGPNIEQSQYGQFKHAGYDYSPNNQYYQTQNPYAQNEGQNMHLSSGAFSDQTYSSGQVYSGNTLFDNKKEYLPAVTSYPQGNIQVEALSTDSAKSIDNATFHNPNSLTQERIPATRQQQSFSQQQLDISLQQNIEQHKSAAFVLSADKTSDNIAYYNPNAYVEENRQIPYNPPQSLDISASFSQPTADLQNMNTASVFTSENSQEPMFYNPIAFHSESQITNTQEPLNVFGSDSQQKTYQVNKNLSSNIHKITSDAQKDSHPICDSALNTSKYNMSSIQKPNVIPRTQFVPASSFFDNPEAINLLQFSEGDEKDDIKLEDVEKQFESKNIEINKLLADTPIPHIVTKSRDDFANIDEQYKEREADNELVLKGNNLIESLSKDNIPILGVSTVPLFGLSTIIANKSREISEIEYEMKNVTLFENAQPSQNLFEGNSGVNFFENMTLDNKLTNESKAKKTSLDITGLSITDVKNVLLIEPPQENIEDILKRNSSSDKLTRLKNTEEASSEHFRQENDNLQSTAFQEQLDLKFDKNASQTFFKHSPSVEKEDKDLENESSVKSQDSELNICETCREVNTPECLRPDCKEENLTNQIIENITSRMPLSNPPTSLLTESDTPHEVRSRFDDQQFEEITHIAEDTIDTIQVATELKDRKTTSSEVNNYGWTTEDAVYSATAHADHDYGFKVGSDLPVPKEQDFSFQIDVSSAVSAADSDYEFKLDPNTIGFFGNNSLFFDNLPKNASDEIKAEIKNSQEDIVLPRQNSNPSAPPAEDDTKSDETGGLDVHSIEQDAKKDFPLEEEFVIEPSETDDDKIEFRERKKSSEDSFSLHDTFTNRIDRFKKEVDNPNDDITKEEQVYGSPPISMASYFDTGNYAVESHYRNSLSSPTSVNNFNAQYNMMRIPPGFEQEYVRRLSGMSLSSGENRSEIHVPDTTTQTRQTSTASYSSPSTRENILCTEIHRQENIEAFVERNTEADHPNISAPLLTISNPVALAMPLPTFTGFATDAQPLFNADIKPTTLPIAYPLQNITGLVDPTYEQSALTVHALPDPMNFFSANVEETTPVSESAAPENINRLASYFSVSPAQSEPSKPFFELSQSQNHYRHESKIEKGDSTNDPKSFFTLSQNQHHYIDDAAKNNINNLMNDLTSPSNIQEQVVRTVNYFTVEYDTEIKRNTNVAAPINVKINDATNIDQNNTNNESPKIDVENKVDTTKLVDRDCKYFEAVINCKFCLNTLPRLNTKDFKVRTAVNGSSDVRTEEVTTEKESTVNKTATMTLGNYDLEGQSQDGVAVINEHRPASEYSPVEHHWFYRVDVEEKSVWRGFSMADSRKLEETWNSPDLNESTLVATDGGRYDVNVVGRLRIAVYWKEKPTNVRRCSWFYKGTTDARYVPYTETVAEKLEDEYRHGVTTGEWHRRLTLPNNEMVIMHGPSVMVHFLHSGATDAFSTPPQAASRPRVVRRGHEESEIEDPEPSKIDHLLLLCHGVGSACDMRFRPVEEVVEDFRSTTLQLLQSHYRNSYENGIVSRVEVLPISWHAQLHSGENGVDSRLSRVTLDSIPRLRAFTNHTVLDVLFYTSPVFHQTIIETVCSEMNRIYNMFKKRNPNFNGDVSLGGHSLGSVILYDLLCHQISESSEPKSPTDKSFVPGTAAADQPTAKYPQLVFPPAALYALGSPIAIFECIRGVETLGMNFSLPTCKNFFNIFHPYDPIAYRIEPLINPQLQGVKPSQIPHHKGRKRMHLELKDTMARVGADLKQKLIESLRTTWNKWKSSPPTDGQLEKVVEEEMEKEQLCEDGKEDAADVQATPEMLGHLNRGRRIDYVLQEAPLEMINEYLFAMSSHVGYWESEDTMLLMLREIYSSLGVQPDCSVPQQNMTVQRTRALANQDEANIIHEKEIPSTSRGST